MKTLRVLHVIPSIGPLRGGPSFVIRTVAAGLAQLGVETHVATTNDNGPELLDVPLDRPVVDNGVVYQYFRRTAPFYVTSAPALRWMSRQIATYDVVHIHTLFSWCSTVAAHIAMARRVPYILRPLGVLNRYGRENHRRRAKILSYRLCEKRMLERAFAVQYTSTQEQREAEELGFRARACIIPNPVDALVIQPEGRHRFLSRSPAAAGKKVILFLSRLDRKKGLDLLITAFAELRKTDTSCILVIAGTGSTDFADTIQRLAGSYGVHNNVIWTGHLDGQAKADAFAAADLFVLPSYSENFGVAAVEAMSAGVPCVLTREVGIADEVHAAGAGWITRGSADDLAHTLRTALADQEGRARVGMSGQRLANDKFSRVAVCERLIELYRGTCQPALESMEGIPNYGSNS